MKLKKTTYRTAAALMLLPALFSCGKESTSAAGSTEDSGTGNLVLSISSEPEVIVTKGSSSVRTPKEGNVMNLLSIWIVNRENGEILIHEHLLAKGESSEGDGSQVEYVHFAEDGKSAQMKFNDIPRGNCTLYAVANFRELDEGVYVVGAKIDDAFRDMLLDQTVEAGKSPVFDDVNGMPCSAVVDFSIGAGDNKVSAEMLRCVGRLTISVRNNIAGSSIFIREIGLSEQNPTNGYVFAHEGGAIPAISKDVAFPELDDFVRVNAMTTDPVQVYDTYLYATDPLSTKPDKFTFSLFGGVYRADTDKDNVKISYRQEYIFDANSSTRPNTADMFAIRSSVSGNYYIGDVDGTLSFRFFSGDTELRHHKGIENWLWKFSGTAGTTITNVGTGRQIRLNGTSATVVQAEQGTTFTMVTNDAVSGGTGANAGIRFQAPDGYSLTIGADDGIYGSNDRNTTLNTHWLIRKAEKGASEAIPYFDGAEYEIPRVDRTMTYIDEYGVAQELNHISRNEHVYLTIGIFYNRELAQLEFEVEKWEKKYSETTFD